MKNKKTAERIPVERNDDIELEITALSSEGQGIGRHEGFAVFVPNVLPNEIVKVHIIKVNKTYAIAKLIEIVKPSNDRTVPVCGEFDTCGGCDLMHLSYEKQLEFKTDRVKNALTRIGGVDTDGIMKNVIGATENLRYRNKASFPLANVDGKVCGGFYAVRSHRLISVEDCKIQNFQANTVKSIVCEWANKYGVDAYDEVRGNGFLRHVVVRTSSKNEVLATIVTTDAYKKFTDKKNKITLPHQKELVEMLTVGVVGLKGIIHNINADRTNVIFGKTFINIWGEDTITESVCGLEFEVGTPSFLQVNHEQTEKLYSIARDFLAAKADETVLDIYSGIGTISLLIAQDAGKVIGIENVKEAVTDARRNAVINGIENAEFIADEAESALPKLIEQGICPNAIVLDPPRKGCDGRVIEAIIKSTAQRVVYVSCNPETLARDVKLLTDAGFISREIMAVDMFPHSCHVETVVLMSRSNP